MTTSFTIFGVHTTKLLFNVAFWGNISENLASSVSRDQAMDFKLIMIRFWG
jgi:hypothetical protein